MSGNIIRSNQWVYHNNDIALLRCYSILGNVNYLHTGPGNTGMNYEMGRSILSKTVKEKDT